MRKKNEPTKPDYRVKILRFLLLATFLAFAFKLTVGKYGFLNMMDLHKQIVELKAEEMQYNVKLVDLELKKSRLLRDSLYIEKLARKNYQLRRPGETVIEY